MLDTALLDLTRGMSENDAKKEFTSISDNFVGLIEGYSSILPDTKGKKYQELTKEFGDVLFNAALHMYHGEYQELEGILHKYTELSQEIVGHLTDGARKDFTGHSLSYYNQFVTALNKKGYPVPRKKDWRGGLQEYPSQPNFTLILSEEDRVQQYLETFGPSFSAIREISTIIPQKEGEKSFVELVDDLENVCKTAWTCRNEQDFVGMWESVNEYQGISSQIKNRVAGRDEKTYLRMTSEIYNTLVDYLNEEGKFKLSKKDFWEW